MSNQAYNLPLMRKYANGDPPCAAIIDQALPYNATISSVSLDARRLASDASETTDITVSNVGVYSGTYIRKNGETYAEGYVIEFDLTGGTRGVTYWVDFAVVPSTSAKSIIYRQPVVID